MKLTGWQLFWMVATVNIIMMLGVALTPTLAVAKQDAWVSHLVAGVVGAAITLSLAKLALLHPNQSFAEMCQAILGKWLGRIVMLPYFCAWIGIASIVLRAQTDFTQMILLHRTPSWIIMMILLILVVYLTRGGIISIGRLSEIAGPILYFLIILSFVLNLKNIRWGRLLPVYVDNGWLNIIMGMVPELPLLGGEAILLFVAVSFMQYPKQAPKRSFLAASMASLVILICSVVSVTVLGLELSVKLNTPFFVFLRAIDIMDFIQNLDVFFIFISIIGTIIKLSSHIFCASYELAKWTGKENWKIMIWFVSCAIGILAFMFHGPLAMQTFLKWWTVLVFPVCVIGIPLLLWVAYLLKGNKTAQP